MEISDIVRATQDGRPYLRLLIDGREARVWLEQKSLALDGIIFIDAEWARDELFVDVDSPCWGKFRARCATDAPEIAALWRQMRDDVAAGTWQTGPC